MIKFLFTLLMFTSCLSFAANQTVDPAVVVAVGYAQGVGVTPVFNSGRYALISNVTVNTGGQTFTCAVTNICTATAHGFGLGTQVTVSTTGTLPTGLAPATTYYVIPLTVNTFSLATSLVNAQAGTAITISGVGTPTNTITYSTLAGGAVKLQGSMDGVVWADLPIKATGDATKSATIAATGVVYLSDWDMSYKFVRAYFTVTAGQITVSNIARSKADH